MLFVHLSAEGYSLLEVLTCVVATPPGRERRDQRGGLSWSHLVSPGLPLDDSQTRTWPGQDVLRDWSPGLEQTAVLFYLSIHALHCWVSKGHQDVAGHGLGTQVGPRITPMDV